MEDIGLWAPHMVHKAPPTCYPARPDLSWMLCCPISVGSYRECSSSFKDDSSLSVGTLQFV